MSTKDREPINTVCAGCGYASPIHHVDPHQARDKLMLHTHYTGKCPITGKHCDDWENKTEGVVQ